MARIPDNFPIFVKNISIMKHIIVILILSMFISCKKETPAVVTPVTKDVRQLSLWGEFVVLDAQLYLDNHETGAKLVYNHFSSSKNVSSLRYDGSVFEIENIMKDVTVYSFYRPQTGNISTFLLNRDSSKVYGLNVTSSFSSIIENPTSGQQLMGGSSRPFSGWTIDYDNKIVILHIEEVEASVGGYNCRYFTELRLRKIKEF